MPAHTYYQCNGGCRDGRSCPYCDGGLAACTVCGGAEGTLTEACVGVKLAHWVLDDGYYKGLVAEAFLHEHRLSLGPDSDSSVLYAMFEARDGVPPQMTRKQSAAARRRRVRRVTQLMRLGPAHVQAALTAARLLEAA